MCSCTIVLMRSLNRGYILAGTAYLWVQEEQSQHHVQHKEMPPVCLDWLRATLSALFDGFVSHPYTPEHQHRNSSKHCGTTASKK
jgi:hypothetical protein